MAVKITNMRLFGTGGKIKAFFAISLGPLDINDCKLVDGSKGMFIGFPSRKYTDKQGVDKYTDIVSLARNQNGTLTTSAQKLADEVLEAALAEYKRRGGEEAALVNRGEEDDLPF